MMMTMTRNSLFPYWMNNPADNDFAAFLLAEMNRMATWKR